jgi:Tol biopolymer transport system component
MRRRRRLWPIAALVAGLVLLVAAVLLARFSGGRATAELPEGEFDALQVLPLTALPGREDNAALSSDGAHVAYTWDGGSGGPDLYQMLVKPSGDAVRLTRDAAAECCPAWSPDGTEIAFIRLEDANRGTVLVVPALGGPTRLVTEVATWIGTSLSWAPDGRSIAVPDRPAPNAPYSVFVVDPAGSRRRLTEPGRDRLGDGFPRFSPDGATLAFARFAVGEILSSVDLYTAPAAGGAPSRVSREALFAVGLDWTPEGDRLVFASGDPLRPWSLTVENGRTEPLPLGPRGVLADRLGVVASEVAGHLGVSLARKRQRLVFSRTESNNDIWRVPLDGGKREPVAASTMGDDSPQLSPDGRRLAFGSTRTGHNEIWLANADGSDPMPLSSLGGVSGTPRWAPDGRSIAFDFRPGGTSDIHVLDVQTLAVRRLTEHPAEDVVPSFSRDGRLLYFGSNRDGRWQVYRMPASGGAAVRVTSHGGFAALESADGATVYYSKIDSTGLWKVPRDGGTETRVAPLRCWGYWDVTPKGVFSLSESDPPRILFVPFATGRPQPVATLAESPNCSDWGLSVSRDGRVLFITERRVQSDVLLVENLR